MLFAKFAARQLGHPAGIFSGFFARTMNRINAGINEVTIQLMEIKPSDRVLEIGFGGGSALMEVTGLLENGHICGIEISDAMLKRARKGFDELISQGKMELKKGNSAKIPYGTGSFDKVYAINCIYFWPDPMVDLKEIHRVLKANGKVALSLRPQEDLDKFPPARHGFILYSDLQLQNLLNEAGFSDIRIEHRKDTPLSATIAIATKKSP